MRFVNHDNAGSRFAFPVFLDCTLDDPLKIRESTVGRDLTRLRFEHREAFDSVVPFGEGLQVPFADVFTALIQDRNAAFRSKLLCETYRQSRLTHACHPQHSEVSFTHGSRINTHWDVSADNRTKPNPLLWPLEFVGVTGSEHGASRPRYPPVPFKTACQSVEHSDLHSSGTDNQV